MSHPLCVPFQAKLEAARVATMQHGTDEQNWQQLETELTEYQRHHRGGYRSLYKVVRAIGKSFDLAPLVVDQEFATLLLQLAYPFVTYQEQAKGYRGAFYCSVTSGTYVLLENHPCTLVLLTERSGQRWRFWVVANAAGTVHYSRQTNASADASETFYRWHEQVGRLLEDIQQALAMCRSTDELSLE